MCDHAEVQYHSHGRVYCVKCQRWGGIEADARANALDDAAPSVDLYAVLEVARAQVVPSAIEKRLASVELNVRDHEQAIGRLEEAMTCPTVVRTDGQMTWLSIDRLTFEPPK